MKTKVIFRKFKDEIVALFPEVDADTTGKCCSSYQHIGQHSGADYNYVISASVPAKPQEYLELKKELEERGYDLMVRQRR